MPFLDTAYYGRPMPLPPGGFWNVSQSVGPILNGPYTPGDVMLLQTLLKEIFRLPRPIPSAPSGPVTPIHGKIHVNGTFDLSTSTHLLHYQQTRNLFGDGQLTKPPVGRSIGINSGKVYTIFLLNEEFRLSDSSWFENLSTDSKTNPMLRAALTGTP
ncbi:hypothetical protein ACYOEI_33090 [Singulisphaera rosea]